MQHSLLILICKVVFDPYSWLAHTVLPTLVFSSWKDHDPYSWLAHTVLPALVFSSWKDHTCIWASATPVLPVLMFFISILLGLLLPVIQISIRSSCLQQTSLTTQLTRDIRSLSITSPYFHPLSSLRLYKMCLVSLYLLHLIPL